jgi:hypothetical protein
VGVNAAEQELFDRVCGRFPEPEWVVLPTAKYELGAQVRAEIEATYASRLQDRTAERDEARRRLDLLVKASGASMYGLDDEAIRDLGAKIGVAMRSDDVQRSAARQARLAADRLESQAQTLRELADGVLL